MEIYTDTTKVTLMPADRTAPAATRTATPVRPVVIEAWGLALGTSLRPVTGYAYAGAVTGSLPVFSSTTDFGTTDSGITNLGSTAWGPPL